jgi:hypothetical protein
MWSERQDMRTRIWTNFVAMRRDCWGGFADAARTPGYIDEGLVSTCGLMSGQRSLDLSSFVQIFEQAFVNLPNLSRPWDRPPKKAEKSLKYKKKSQSIYRADNLKYTSLKWETMLWTCTLAPVQPRYSPADQIILWIFLGLLHNGLKIWKLCTAISRLPFWWERRNSSKIFLISWSSISISKS